MIYFLSWGHKYYDKRVKDGIVVEKRCQKCKDYRTLYEFQSQKWFALFGISVFPEGYEGSSFLKCLSCDTNYYLSPDDIDVNDESRLIDFDNRILVSCTSCNSKLKIPPLEKNEVKIRCKKCENIFTVKKSYVKF